MDFLNWTDSFSPDYYTLVRSDGASTTPHTFLSSRVIAIVLLALPIWRIYTLFVRPLLSPNRHLPSPNQGWALFRLLHEPNVNELEIWMDTIPNAGLIRYFGLWNEERLYATSPAAVADLLVKQADHYIKPRLQFVLAHNIAAEGLLILEGDRNKTTRKAFQPAFSPERIRKSYPIMLQSAADAVAHVAAQIAAKGQAEILKPVSTAAIDIIGEWGYSRKSMSGGDKSTCTSTKSASFVKAYLRMFKTTKRGQWTLDAAAKIGPELALRLPLRAVQTIKGVMALVREISEDIVIEHQNDPDSRDDMLSTVMKTGLLSHTELVDETVHFFAAATETTGGSIAWAIHLLSRHPDMQARLRREIRATFPSQASLLDANPSSVLEHMPYLNAVINEVLRFHSINTILWRQSVSTRSTICGHHVPLGTKVTFSPWALNRDPCLWGPDAREFNPERWVHDPVSGGADKKYSFLTFGAGPRRCIGEGYAKAQIRCLVAALVGAFEWAPTDELRGDNGSDVGEEIGDNHALTLFKILEGWTLACTAVPGWL